MPRRSTQRSVARHDTRNVTRSGRFSSPGDRRRRRRRQRVGRRRRLERRRGRARARARWSRSRRRRARRAVARGGVRATRRRLGPRLGRLSAARSETGAVARSGERSDRTEREEKKVTAVHLQVREWMLPGQALVPTSGGEHREPSMSRGEETSLSPLTRIRPCRSARRLATPPEPYAGVRGTGSRRRFRW